MSATVRIPGVFTAEYVEGQIVGFTFMPSASDAGYFGPAAETIDHGDFNCETCGHRLTCDDRGVFCHVEENAQCAAVRPPAVLDVESVDGPFWRAVQEALRGAPPLASDTESINVRWSE